MQQFFGMIMFTMMAKFMMNEIPHALGLIDDEPIIRPGLCFPNAWRYVVRSGKGMLVHGTVWSQSLGKRIQHAWVELPYGYVWDPTANHEFTIEAYNYDVSPIAEHKYTPEEASILAARTGNLGPWTKVEQRRWL